MPFALVTGVGHREGIGFAVASILEARGTKVFVTRWSEFDLKRHYSQNTDVPWPSMDADLEDPGSPSSIFDAAEAALGTIDILILNHAHFERDDLRSVRSDVLDRHMAINVRGSLLLCQEFVRRNRTGWGRIVFLTSGQSLHPMPLELSYAASKGAIEAASLALAGDLASVGVTVNTVDPGGTNTGWIPAELRDRWAAESPLGRIGEPIDAARLIGFLTSEEGGWITGQLIRSRGAAL
ncbi:MAG: SDR family oxidoreductase [Fimbriimonadaceae bacterium]